MRPFELVRATTPAEALAARSAKQGALFKAGGTDLLDVMKEGVVSPARLVDLLSIGAEAGEKLRGILAAKEPVPGLSVGALVTLAELAESALAREQAPAVAEAAAEAATPQIRNRGTVGGNLLQRSRCWFFRSQEYEPCHKRGGSVCHAIDGDNRIHAIFETDEPCVRPHPSSLAPALVALEAQARVLGADGRERWLPVEDLFVGASAPERENALAEGELLLSVTVPSKGLRCAYRELAERQTLDWALASAAVALALAPDGTIASARVVLGGVAHRPWRAKAAEAALAGKKPEREVARAAAAAAVEGAKPLRDNGHKVPIVKALVARAVLAAAGVEGAK